MSMTALSQCCILDERQILFNLRFTLTCRLTYEREVVQRSIGLEVSLLPKLIIVAPIQHLYCARLYRQLVEAH